MMKYDENHSFNHPPSPFITPHHPTTCHAVFLLKYFQGVASQIVAAMKRPSSALTHQALKKAKGTALKKANKTKAAKGAALKKAKGKALKKAPKALGKAKVNSRNLAKLGQLSLKEKVKKIAEEHDDEIEAAMVLQENMTAQEKTRAWNRYNKFVEKPENDGAKEVWQNQSRKDKGLSTALHLMRTESPKFCFVAKQAQYEQSLEKEEKWLSEKEAYDKWGEETLNKHISSGRVVWREMGGVYEYQDTMDYTRKSRGTSTKTWQVGQEFQLQAEEQNEWETFFEKDLQQFLTDQSKSKGTSLAKGKGKNKGGNPGKGGKGEKDPVKALDLLPEDEQFPEALKKLKKTRDLTASCLSNFEEALEKVKKSPYMSKQSLKDKQEILQDLTKALQKVKKVLNKGEKNTLDEMKTCMLEVAAVVKTAKEEAKEVVQLGQKALSKASKN